MPVSARRLGPAGDVATIRAPGADTAVPVCTRLPEGLLRPLA